jgi:membrane protease subunit HflC
MRAYQTIIADNTTLVLSTDSDLFKYLKGMNPDDQPLTTPSVEAQRQ